MPRLLSAHQLALKLVPVLEATREARWLEEQAQLGRLPHVLVGEVVRFDETSVVDVLVARARATASRFMGEPADRWAKELEEQKAAAAGKTVEA